MTWMIRQSIPSARLQMTEKLGGVAYTPDTCAAIQRDKNSPKKWVTENSSRDQESKILSPATGEE